MTQDFSLAIRFTSGTIQRMPKTQLEITDLKVSIKDTQILKGVSLTVRPGEIHAIMGPNGSGKSTLAATLAGHPDYEVDSGSIMLDGQNVLELSPDERAKLGIFLAFQYPVEIPGVSVRKFLKLAYEARFAEFPERKFKTIREFAAHLNQVAESLSINPALLGRGLNEGFSGGEKKQLEMLQMTLLEPKFAILDETDSGLDIDALKRVAIAAGKSVQKYQTGMIVITHYQRILNYLKPDFVHIVQDGLIARSGDASLAHHIEQHGYVPESV